MNGANCCSEENSKRDLVGGMQMTPPPYKSFNECPIEEKIIRLHVELKSMKQTISFFWKENDELRLKIAMLENHYHGDGGAVMVRIQDKSEQYRLRGAGLASSSFDMLA